MGTVLVRHEANTLTVRLNRPERLNAVCEELYTELLAHLDAAECNPDTRCVILTGSGRAFCAGADLKAHREGTRSPAERERYVALGQRVCECIQRMATPVVAAVHGYALGAGAELAVSADFLVVAEDAQLGFPEATLGTFVGGGVTRRLPRLVGLRRAIDLLLLGERFTGAQAADWGLARCVRPDEVPAAAHELATTLVRNAPASLGRLKAALSRTDSLTETLAAEARDLLEVMATDDWAEGIAAFAERRATSGFTGS